MLMKSIITSQLPKHWSKLLTLHENLISTVTALQPLSIILSTTDEAHFFLFFFSGVPQCVWEGDYLHHVKTTRSVT